MTKQQEGYNPEDSNFIIYLKYISTVTCTNLDIEWVLPQESKQRTNFMKTFRKGCSDRPAKNTAIVQARGKYDSALSYLDGVPSEFKND